MDGNAVMSAITTVGFPIVMCLILMWYVKDSSAKHREDIDKINSQHMEEMTGVREALNNNTLAIQKLCDKLCEQKFYFEQTIRDKKFIEDGEKNG